MRARNIGEQDSDSKRRFVPRPMSYLLDENNACSMHERIEDGKNRVIRTMSLHNGRKLNE